MFHGTAKWNVDELSQAMANAINQNASDRLIKQQGDVVKFNGFWRNGNKQNVCAWLNKATWADAKTGEGGGCKEFAKVAFNLNLPEFMERFGSQKSHQPYPEIKRSNNKELQRTPLVKPIEQIFQELSRNDNAKNDRASNWLQHDRRFIDPRSYIGSGFANLTQSKISFFDTQHRAFVEQRLQVADQIVVPLRAPHSSHAQNLFFRSISPCAKEDKSRLLPNAGGWQETDETPRSFGFPHLINEFSNLIICEGMADYLACELLLDREHKFLPIGAGSATALPKWAHWLVDNKFNGFVLIIFHLDQDKHGNLSDIGIGQDNAVKCANHLHSAGIKAKLFPWLRFMKRLNNFTEVRDLADVFKIELELEHLQKIFLQTIAEEADA